MSQIRQVLADDREQGSLTFKALESRSDVKLNVARLNIGDYRVEDGLIFERKSLRDFAASIKDGRLFRQASRLVSIKDRGVILLEGTSTQLDESRMSRESIQGALISLSLIYGIPLLRAVDAAESADLILSAATQLENHSKNRAKRTAGFSHGKKKRQLYILQGLPGIGVTRAESLLNHFGNVENVFKASTQELQQTEGIGVQTAEMINWAVSETRGTYSTC